MSNYLLVIFCFMYYFSVKLSRYRASYKEELLVCTTPCHVNRKKSFKRGESLLRTKFSKSSCKRTGSVGTTVSFDGRSSRLSFIYLYLCLYLLIYLCVYCVFIFMYAFSTFLNLFPSCFLWLQLSRHLRYNLICIALIS